jgi:acyl-coenzyme A thioesterase PaaI-like protein
MLLTPNPTNSCFGCGAANPRGMQLTYEQDDATRSIIALVLDEAMGKVNRFRGVRAVTAELTIEYIRPVPVDEDLIIEAHEVEKDGRNLHYVGEISNRAGKLLARGKGRFVEIDPDKFKIERAEASVPGNHPS